MERLSNQDSFQTYGGTLNFLPTRRLGQPSGYGSTLTKEVDGLGIQLQQAQEKLANFDARLDARLAPNRALEKLRDYWNLSDDQMLRMCGISTSTLSLSQSLKAYLEWRDIKQRAQLLMSIRARLSTLFQGNRETERAWLRAPWARIDGARPLDAMLDAKLPDLARLSALIREMVGA